MGKAAYTWDFFLAHAGADLVAAEALYDLLTSCSRVFLDSRCLLPGDDWDQELSLAQSSALITVVLVSSRTERAYYQREEIAAAIDMARKDKSKHRVVPIYLDEQADTESSLPYGLRLKHGLSVSKAGGLGEIARRLNDLLNHLQERTFIPEEQDGTAVIKQTTGMDRYQIIHTIHEGHYSRAIKCRIQETGEVCVVKKTDGSRVNINALYALKNLNCPNIAAPRVIWEEGGMVYEELPYVGGVRLSNAVAPGIGGLTGSVLESFHAQFMFILGEMHEAQIIHRDIHPDNIYLVINRKGETSSPNSDAVGAWRYYHFGHGDEMFLLAWILVDCTFATLVSEASKSRYRHGSYTPEEQEMGAASPASDMYAFGATLYYGITGEEIPPYQIRRKEPESLDYPSGGHPSVGFPRHLERLLTLDASERPLAPHYLSPDSVGPGYTGTLRLSDKELLAADHFPSETRILTGRDALYFYQGQHFYSPQEQYRRVDYWVNLLKSKGVRE